MKAAADSIFNVVLGTAGHIDHGKSTLVKRLTGIDPDRLPEEKARGLTIDIGFSRLTLPNGRRVGIIDVPGHERLIKNMVAGATGIDLVLLVVAADDGVMPQTREHLAIMQLLGLQRGIAVITKVDAVDGDLLELVKEEVEETLRGTFLEGSPLVAVSSVTGEGIDQLLAALYSEIAALKPKDSSGIFRMPIQRVFSAKGFGTVVTGVPVSGRTRAGETLEIVPLGRTGRVRGIQAYGEPIETARAGHSSAVNLADVDYRQVERGMVLTAPGYFRAGTLFEARFKYLPSRQRPLVHQTTVRLHVGTLETLGKVHLLEGKKLDPGQESYVQLRLEEPAVAAPGDRFVLRLHSPLETIGGGEILGRSRWKLKSGKPYVKEILHEKEQAIGDPHRWIVSLVETTGWDAVAEKELAVQAAMPVEAARALVEELIADGQLRRSGRSGLLLSTRRLKEAEKLVLKHAQQYFEQNPRRLFLDKLKLRQLLGCHDVFFQELVQSMTARGHLTEEKGNRLRFRDFGPRLRPEEEELRQRILAALEETPFTPPGPAEIAQRVGREAESVRAEDVRDMLLLLEEEGEILRLAEDVYFPRSGVEDAWNRIRAHLESEGTMTASDARKILGSTRKYSIPLLEHFDREGLTVRRGDLRELRVADR